GLERERIGRFILGTILGLVTYTTFIGTLGSAREMGLRPELVTSPILLFHVALVVWFIRRSRFPLAFFGLTLHRWPARAMEAIIWSLPILALSVVLKAILVGGTDTPLLAAWPGSPGGVSYPPGYLAIYLAFVPAQELIFRGFLQSCLRSFFVSRHRAIEANLATNLVFFVTHLHLSVPLGIAAFVAGLVWGQLYERQNSLVGVSVAHALVGFWSFAVLGLPGFY
ncbi:MAG: CPBP family intramembrane glutamic endopeptidase, partial [Myxococcota bacterium]